MRIVYDNEVEAARNKASAPPPADNDLTPPATPSDGESPEYEEEASFADLPPAYSAQANAVHTFKLLNKAKEPWLKLHIQNKTRATGKLPRLLEGEPLEGNVEVALEKPDTVKSVVIKIVGEMITDQNYRMSFVDVTQEIWSVSSGSEPQASNHGKIQGAHTWPFSITLPASVELKDFDNGSHLKSWSLPASFMSFFARITITYRVVVIVKHGTFRPDHLLGVNVMYIPRIQPGPPSAMRQLAYEENVALPGLDADPEGWHSLPPHTFKGTLFSARDVDVKYTLSLAKPLSYTRGSVIPLLLTIESDDAQARDLLSSPDAPRISLRQSLYQNYDSGGAGSYFVPTKLAEMVPVPMLKFSSVARLVGGATWWVFGSEEKLEHSSGKRTLQGEIHLERNLFPSAHMGLYKLYYEVSMFDVKSPGFVLAHPAKADEPLQSVAVEIGTIWPDGPRPISYAPPPSPSASSHQ